MRPAAPVKMTSGIYSPTSMGMVDRDSRPRTHLSARLTARPSTRKYLEPFQILVSAGAGSGAAGAFLTRVRGQKARVSKGVARRRGLRTKAAIAAIQGHDRAYLL